jgi:hypothetical protein
MRPHSICATSAGVLDILVPEYILKNIGKLKKRKKPKVPRAIFAKSSTKNISSRVMTMNDTRPGKASSARSLQKRNRSSFLFRRSKKRPMPLGFLKKESRDMPLLFTARLRQKRSWKPGMRYKRGASGRRDCNGRISFASPA